MRSRRHARRRNAERALPARLVPPQRADRARSPRLRCAALRRSAAHRLEVSSLLPESRAIPEIRVPSSRRDAPRVTALSLLEPRLLKELFQVAQQPNRLQHYREATSRGRGLLEPRPPT